MNLEEARAWLQTSTVSGYMQQMDDEAETAVETMERTIRRMGLYSSAVQSEYRRAGSSLDAAQRAFNAEVNAISYGRARDGRAAMAAYRAFSAALLALQGMNARNAAAVEADVASLVEAVFTAGARFASSRVQRETRAMVRDLERLRDRLQRARRQRIGAEAQRAINVFLGVIGIALGLATGVEEAAAAFGVASAAISTVLDTVLGPGTPDAFGAANTGVGLLSGLADGVGRTISTVSGGCTTFVSFLADCSEVELAEANLRGVSAEVNAANRTFRDYARHIASESSELTVAKRLADGAIRDARARARAYREARDEFRELERGLADIR